MAKHQWSVLCRKSIVDKDDNVISLLDVLEEIRIIGALPQDMHDKNLELAKSGQGNSPLAIQLVSFWIREDKKKSEVSSGRVLIIDPKGKEITKQEFKIDLSKATRTRHKMIFPGVPFNGNFGIYNFITQQKKGGKARWITVSENLFEVKGDEKPPLEKITF